MKRKVLVMLVPTLLVTGATDAAEVYSKDGNKLDLHRGVVGPHYFSDDSGDDGDMSYARIGFKGETQVADQFTGYDQWKSNIDANGPESDKDNTATRLAFADLDFGQGGTFDYGRNCGVIYDIGTWADMLPEFGGDTYTDADNFMNGRTNGVATYRNNGFSGQVDGLNSALQYQGSNEGGRPFGQKGSGNNDGHSLSKENGDGFGMSASYDFDFGLSLGTTYQTLIVQIVRLELIQMIITIAAEVLVVGPLKHGLLVQNMMLMMCI